MRFHHATAEIYVPDGLPVGEALARTTHLAIGAHPDDLEIMAAAPIIQCFQRRDQWFTGVVVTDGRGSPWADLYRENSDEQMRRVRFQEQRKAAVIGEYGALVSLDYPSEAVKDRENHKSDEDVSSLLKIARPVHVFTHNLADRHDTHIAVAMRVIRAIRSLPGTDRPERLFGCVVWRDLDWMLDEDKVTFDLSSHKNIQTALLGIYDSQISGGKRYDLATMGRRQAAATYFESHRVDTSRGLTYAMDLTPLLLNPDEDVLGFIQAFIDRFAGDVASRLRRFV